MINSLTSGISSGIGCSITYQKGGMVMDVKTKVRVNRLRRMASRQGLRLEKNRRRDPMALDYGKYNLVSGKSGHLYVHVGQADLDQLEAWLSGKRPRKAVRK